MNVKKAVIVDDKNPSMYGILNGYCKGLHWSHDKGGFKLDVLYSYCVGGCGVVGEISNGKEREAKDFFYYVFDSLKNNGIYEFEFSTEDDVLRGKILGIFSEKTIYSEMEYSYRRIMVCDSKKKIPDYDFIEVDKIFLNQLNYYENSQILLTRINDSWHSKDDFLQYSEAVVALKGKRVIGVIFGSARYLNVIDVDIEVLEDYRSKGIAKELTTQFVNSCVRRGCVVQWDCVESNLASRKVAEECGFELFKKRPYYWFEI